METKKRACATLVNVAESLRLANEKGIPHDLVGGNVKVAGGGALADTPGDVVMRAVAGAVEATVVTWGNSTLINIQQIMFKDLKFDMNIVVTWSGTISVMLINIQQIILIFNNFQFF